MKPTADTPAPPYPQPDQQKFEVWYGGPNAPSHAFDKSAEGFYKYSATNAPWSGYQAGWKDCAAALIAADWRPPEAALPKFSDNSDRLTFVSNDLARIEARSELGVYKLTECKDGVSDIWFCPVKRPWEESVRIYGPPSLKLSVEGAQAFAQGDYLRRRAAADLAATPHPAALQALLSAGLAAINSAHADLTRLQGFHKRLEALLIPAKPALTFDDALCIARGCPDYGGGYHDKAEYEIFQHGIQTVINALSAAVEKGLKDSQVRALHNIGAQPNPESKA